jgi:hypothetical protein
VIAVQLLFAMPYPIAMKHRIAMQYWIELQHPIAMQLPIAMQHRIAGHHTRASASESQARRAVILQPIATLWARAPIRHGDNASGVRREVVGQGTRFARGHASRGDTLREGTTDCSEILWGPASPGPSFFLNASRTVIPLGILLSTRMPHVTSGATPHTARICHPLRELSFDTRAACSVGGNSSHPRLLHAGRTVFPSGILPPNPRAA